MREQQRRTTEAKLKTTPWDSSDGAYVNSWTGKRYAPHTDEELSALNDDTTPHVIALGGEGSGKTTWLVIKTLERLRRGCNGIMGSPDLPHFIKSLWSEFQRWCPWHHVVESQRYRAMPEWAPSHAFTLNFINGAELFCGGFKDPMSWEGGNVNFAAYDEVRRQGNASMIKVLSGRVRIRGPRGTPPQIFYSSTPRMNWMHEYFGPVNEDGEDPQAAFKRRLRRLNLSTTANLSNLDPDYVLNRSAGLSGTEQLVYIEGKWADTDEDEAYLPTITWWDNAEEDLPPLKPREAMVLAADAATDNDSFGLIGITQHPADPSRTAVRFVQEWTPPQGGQIDFGEPYEVVRRLTQEFNVAEITYDPYQLHYFMTKVKDECGVFVVPFSQAGDRLEADKALRDAILARGIAHDGNDALRRHLSNANRQMDALSRKIRIVKRTQSLKIDLAVCLSMAHARARTVLF